MSVKHTPGPWAVGEIDDDTGQINIVGDGLFIAGAIDGFIDGGVTQSANARLIAAAPELLDALEKIEQQLDYGQIDTARRIATSAIAKAKGVP